MRYFTGFFFDWPLSMVYPGILGISILLLFSFIRINILFISPLLFSYLSGCLMLLYGILITALTKPENDPLHYIHCYESGSLLRIRIAEELNHNDYYFKYRAEVFGVDEKRTKGNIMIKIQKNGIDELMDQDQVLFTFNELTEFKGVMNPGGYNVQQAMRRKKIHHQITLNENEFVQFSSDINTLRASASKLRDRIIKSLKERGFSKNEFSVIEALLLGRRQDISSDLESDYQNAGAMHLLAISGLHIGILLFMLNWILKPMERYKSGKLIKFILLVTFLWIFAFIAGLSPSVIRAVGMFTILTIGLFSKRRNHLAHYLFTALFLSLLVNPMYLFDIGFQLSYTAVLSIIIISPLIKPIFRPRHKILNYFWNLLVVSIAAQIGVLPLGLFYFHQFSALFFLSSLCIIPFLGIVLGMGYFMILLDQFDLVPDFYISLFGWMIQMMNQTISVIGNLEGLIFRDVFFSFSLLTLCYVMIIFLVSGIKTYSKKWMFASLVCGILISLTFLVEKILTQTSSDFIVFHQYKQSLFLVRRGNRGTIYMNKEHDMKTVKRFLSAYQLEHFTLKVKDKKQAKHFFKIGECRIMVVDQSFLKDDFGFGADVLILANSPNINLERFIKNICPKTIVADGSNYYSYKSRWRSTAEKYDIEFYDTFKEGAYIHTK